MVMAPGGSVTLVRYGEPRKAPGLTVVTLDGIDTLVRPVLRTAWMPMEVTLDGIATLLSFAQSANA